LKIVAIEFGGMMKKILLLILTSLCYTAYAEARNSALPFSIKTENRLAVFLSNFQGKYWVQSDLEPLQYIKFGDTIQDGVLELSGMDNDGNVIAGYFSEDPATSRIQAKFVRHGQISSFEAAISNGNLILTGKEGGIPIRQSYFYETNTEYELLFEELRNNRWIEVRRVKYAMMVPKMVTALQWIEKNPRAEAEAALAREALMKSQPNFFRRLRFAVEEGLIVGVKSGLEEGINYRINRAINPEKK
jgi:hypothetical protein